MLFICTSCLLLQPPPILAGYARVVFTRTYSVSLHFTFCMTALDFRFDTGSSGDYKGNKADRPGLPKDGGVERLPLREGQGAVYCTHTHFATLISKALVR